MEKMVKIRSKHPIQSAIKRLFDLFFSLLLLPLFLLFLPIIAFLIKIDSTGPIFFRDERMGRLGHPFKCWKFRTMVLDADAHSPAVGEHDERITRVGHWLRKTSLDELPQIINILKGDMSMVGPRPALLSLAGQYTPHQAYRLQVRPGLTGWLQINGRNTLPYEERLEYDIWYAHNWTILLDLKILLKTPVVVLSQKGIYHPVVAEKAVAPAAVSTSLPINQE